MEVFAEPILYLCYKLQRKEDISVWGGRKHESTFLILCAINYIL